MGDASTGYSQTFEGKASAERNGHLICCFWKMKPSFVSLCQQCCIHTKRLCVPTCCFHIKPPIPSVLHSSSGSNLEKFKHVEIALHERQTAGWILRTSFLLQEYEWMIKLD